MICQSKEEGKPLGGKLLEGKLLEEEDRWKLRHN